jgi:hypothetical protein
LTEKFEPNEKVRVKSFPLTLASMDEATPSLEVTETFEAPQFSADEEATLSLAATLPVLGALTVGAGIVLGVELEPVSVADESS